MELVKAWRWTGGGGCWHLLDGAGRTRATIWNVGGQFAWGTWNAHGTGGENDATGLLNDAKDQCVAAIVRQGWAPGGWQVEW